MTENHDENRLSYLASIGIVSHQFIHDINNVATVALLQIDQLRSNKDQLDQSQIRMDKLEKSIRELIKICNHSNELFKNSDMLTVSGEAIRGSVEKIFSENLKKHGIIFNIDHSNWNFSAFGRLSEWSALFYNHIADAKDRFYEKEDFTEPSQITVNVGIFENSIILTISDNAPRVSGPNRCDDIGHQTIQSSLQVSKSYKFENFENIYEYALNPNLI